MIKKSIAIFQTFCLMDFASTVGAGSSRRYLRHEVLSSQNANAGDIQKEPNEESKLTESSTGYSGTRKTKEKKLHHKKGKRDSKKTDSSKKQKGSNQENKNKKKKIKDKSTNSEDIAKEQTSSLNSVEDTVIIVQEDIFTCPNNEGSCAMFHMPVECDFNGLKCRYENLGCALIAGIVNATDCDPVTGDIGSSEDIIVFDFFGN